MNDVPAKVIYDAIQPRYPEFKNQIAIVTGSGRGIGRGIAIRLAREGMKIVVHGLDSEEVVKTHAELTELGVDAIAVASDLRDSQGVDQIFDETISAFGSFSLLVNNAAEMKAMAFFDVDEAKLDSQLAANIRAPYLCTYRAAEFMREKGAGNIINISSVGGLRAHWKGLPYDVAKGAIDAMTRTMALELAEFGIRVNAIAPGAIQTRKNLPDYPFYREAPGRIPLERFGTPQEIGATVAFLASPEAAYITGQVIYVDGGITSQLSPKGLPI